MEKGLAIEYTLHQVKNTPLNKDYAFAWMSKLLKAAKSAIMKAKSGAKRPPKPYLGAVLILTRIAYGSLDALGNLPPVWRVPEGAAVESKTMPKAPLPKRVRRRKVPQPTVEKPLTTRSKAKATPEADTQSSSKEPSLHAQDESRGEDEEVAQFKEVPQGVMGAVETEILRDITVSLNQDTDFVLKLHKAVQEAEEKRRQQEELENQQKEAERRAARAAAMEAKRGKGKEKVQEGEGTSSDPVEAQVPVIEDEILAEEKEAILAQLRVALDNEPTMHSPQKASEGPLQHILHSFTIFYKKMQQSAI